MVESVGGAHVVEPIWTDLIPAKIESRDDVNIYATYAWLKSSLGHQILAEGFSSNYLCFLLVLCFSTSNKLNSLHAQLREART